MEITPEIKAYMASLGKLGGNRRLQTTTPEQRRKIARMGAKARILKDKLSRQDGTGNADKPA